ncbi:MAG: N-acetylmuramoyl-L-alanine amidase [Azospirillaceae bacterium]
MRPIRKIVIHCAATPEGQDVKLEAIRRYHVEQRGFSDIGYHWVIELDGTVRQGRPEWAIGAHVKGQNLDSIGVCYVGGLTSDGRQPKDTRTPAQRRALVDLVRQIKQRHGPLSVHGHREYANKACPCFEVAAEGDLHG